MTRTRCAVGDWIDLRRWCYHRHMDATWRAWLPGVMARTSRVRSSSAGLEMGSWFGVEALGVVLPRHRFAIDARTDALFALCAAGFRLYAHTAELVK